VAQLVTRRGALAGLLAAPAIIRARSLDAQTMPLIGGGPSGALGPVCDPSFADVTLLAHCDGTNGGTSLTDSSNVAQSITASGGAALSTSIKEFGSASVEISSNSGTSPIVTCSGAASNYAFAAGNFTVECWAYWLGGTAGSFPGLVNFFPQAVNCMWGLVWNLGNNPATLAFNWSTDGSSFSNNVETAGAYAPAANTWISYACDRSGNVFRLYVNGAVVATKTASDTIFTALTGSCTIGNWGSTSSETWQGYIDEVRVTKGVARYAGAYTPATAAFPNC
jgi:hypothetical protein